MVKTLEKTCETCEKVFYVSEAYLKYNKKKGKTVGRYCSVSCKKVPKAQCLDCDKELSVTIGHTNLPKRCHPCSGKVRLKNPKTTEGKYTHKKGRCIDCHAEISDIYRSYCGSCSHSQERNHKWKGGISQIPGYSSINENKRRAHKANSRETFTHNEWEELKAKYQHMCLCCKKEEPEIKLTIDHIIPLSKGGDNSIKNIQPLCRSCNCRKHVKTINYIKILTT